jgi:hypothetical protein
VLAVAAGAGADDSVKTKAAKSVNGTIQEESPKGIMMRGAKTLIPAADIVDVIYQAPVVIRQDFYRPALNAEAEIEKAKDRKTAIADAINKYQKLLEQLADKQYASARRHIQYKIAALTAQQALEEGTSLDGAKGKLKDFKDKHSDSWQITACARLLAQLLIDSEKYKEAEEVYKDLAANSAFPKETQDQFQLQATQVSLRAQKYDEALKKLQGLIDSLPNASPQKNQARVYQAEALVGMKKYADAQSKLTALLKEAKDDKDLRALAFNTLGLCYLRQENYKEALWEFLRVDVVYNQNKDEHARALYNLYKLFHLLKDAERGDECAARLKNKKFAGTEYQRRLLKDEAVKGKEK